MFPTTIAHTVTTSITVTTILPNDDNDDNHLQHQNDDNHNNKGRGLRRVHILSPRYVLFFPPFFFN